MISRDSIIDSVRWLFTLGIFLACIVSFDHLGRSRRYPDPGASPQTTPYISVVNTNQDVYAVAKRRGLRGGALIQFSRFLNMVERYPKTEASTVPFPIKTHDVAPSYEKLLDPHSWVFIAAQTGMVRRVLSVVPDARKQAELAEGLSTEYGFHVRRDGSVRGYFLDIPLDVVTLDQIEAPDGPVMVTVDASYFTDRTGPEHVARAIARVPNIDSIMIVLSRDEPDVTDTMRLEAAAVRSYLDGKP